MIKKKRNKIFSGLVIVFRTLIFGIACSGVKDLYEMHFNLFSFQTRNSNNGPLFCGSKQASPSSARVKAKILKLFRKDDIQNCQVIADVYNKRGRNRATITSDIVEEIIRDRTPSRSTRKKN